MALKKKPTTGMKDMYAHRKETIERCFGTAKEHHGMRYTQQIGNEKMRMLIQSEAVSKILRIIKK